MTDFTTICSNQIDILTEIITYTSFHDILKFSILSKYFNIAMQADYLWLILLIRDIVPIQFSLEKKNKKNYGNDIKFFNHIKEILQIQDRNYYRKIYFTFKPFQHRLLGYYRLIPQTGKDYRGGLDAIYIDENKKLSLNIFGSNTKLNFDWINDNKIIATDIANQVFTMSATKFVNEVSVLNKSLMHLYNQISADACVPISMKSKVVISKLHENNNLKNLNDFVFDYSCLKSVLGLFEGIYGPHGTELLHVALHDPNASCHDRIYDYCNTLELGNSPQIHGLKIIGDPHVPANKLSFCFPIMNSVSIDEVVDDQRPCVTFDNDHVPIIFNLSSRYRFISYWCQGFGQINLNSNEWNPSWIKANFIVYNPPIKTDTMKTVTFSVLFENYEHEYRHVIDFSTFDSLYDENSLSWI